MESCGKIILDFYSAQTAGSLVALFFFSFFFLKCRSSKIRRETRKMEQKFLGRGDLGMKEGGCM